MSHDFIDRRVTNSEASQAVFLGWLAVLLLGVMAAFTIVVLGSAALHGFS